MTRVVIKFKDGGFFNAEADGIFSEGSMICAYKRLPAEQVVKQMSCYQTVGLFHRDDIIRAYVTDKAEDKA